MFAVLKVAITFTLVSLILIYGSAIFGVSIPFEWPDVPECEGVPQVTSYPVEPDRSFEDLFASRRTEQFDACIIAIGDYWEKNPTGTRLAVLVVMATLVSVLFRFNALSAGIGVVLGGAILVTLGIGLPFVSLAALGFWLAQLLRAKSRWGAGPSRASVRPGRT